MKAGKFQAVLSIVERNNLKKDLVIDKFGKDRVADCFVMTEVKQLRVVKA